MTYLTDLEQLVATAALPHLHGFARGGARAQILDAMQAERISASEAFALLVECDKRIDAEGVRFVDIVDQADDAKPAEPAGRRELPAPFVPDDETLRWCAGARWCPDAPVPTPETLAEAGSRVWAFVLACRIARSGGRDLEERDRRAIWAAVAAQVALVARRREAA